MAKPTRSSDGKARHRVWQPKGYDGIEIGIKSGTAELYFPKRFLDNYTIVLNGRGHGSARYGDERYRFERMKHLVFLQQPDKVFSGRFSAEEGTGGACIVFPPEVLMSLERSLGLQVPFSFQEMLLPERLNAYIANLTAKTISAFSTHRSRLERETRLLSLVEALAELALEAPVPDMKLGEERVAISTVKEAINADPGKAHSISDLAQMTCLNQKYLIDIFTRDVGIPPHLYLTVVRIALAKKLLVKGEAIADISRRLGFYDQSHFSNTFKRYVQVPPGRFKLLSVQNL